MSGICCNDPKWIVDCVGVVHVCTCISCGKIDRTGYESAQDAEGRLVEINSRIEKARAGGVS